MDFVKVVELPLKDETFLSTITIEKYGKEATIHWKIAGYLEGSVAIDPKVLEALSGVLRLTVQPKSTSTFGQ